MILISHKIGGYGKRFMEWVAKPNLQPPYQSFGNGSAMPVSPCAWLAESLDELPLPLFIFTVDTPCHDPQYSPARCGRSR